MTEAKYSTHTYNLSIKRVDTPVNLSGGSINVLAVKGDCFIKINDKSQDPINLLHTANIKTKFTKFYLSNNVQVGGYVTIVIGKHCEFELTTNIAQATHTSLLLPQQNIPAHLRDRAIGAPEVINVWDIENATIRNSFNIRTNDGIGLLGLFFRPDGLKMYTLETVLTLGVASYNVNEYNLGKAWDISTIVFKHSFDIGAQSTNATDLFFSSDGAFMYILDGFNNIVFPYYLSTKWLITTASYLSTPLNIVDHITSSTNIFLNPTGHKMYIKGLGLSYLLEYDLNPAWDITTAAFNHFINLAPKITNPKGLFFSPDGLKVYIIEKGNIKNNVLAYRLLEAWNVTTAIFHQSFDYSLIVSNPRGLFFNPDGSKMYILSSSSLNIYEFDL